MSKAAGSFCMWLHAVSEYVTIHNDVIAKQKTLKSVRLKAKAWERRQVSNLMSKSKHVKQNVQF